MQAAILHWLRGLVVVQSVLAADVGTTTVHPAISDFTVPSLTIASISLVATS